MKSHWLVAILLAFVLSAACAQGRTISTVGGSVPVTGSIQQADYLLKVCQETERSLDPNSAIRGLDPAGWLALELGNRSKRNIFNSPSSIGAIEITLLEGTKHGDLVAKTSGSGRVYYMYDAKPDYQGKDKAVFMAKFEGKRYKVVVNLIVQLVVDERTPLCPTPQLIKIQIPRSHSPST